jgi:hypothetical protein
MQGMVLAPLVNLATDFISSLFSGSSGSSTTPAATQSAKQTSPFAQVLSSLQQSDPAEFQTVAQQVANFLKKGAQTATADGHTALSSQLTQLSTDFSTVSTTGQLPPL